MANARRAWRIPLYFGLLFALYVSAPAPIPVTAHARFDLTRAIVHDQSFQIDRYVANTVDWSRRDGHYYSNKAPGVSFLAVPIYLAAVGVEQMLGMDPERLVNANLRGVDLVLTALPSVLLCLLLLGYLTQHLRLEPERAWIAVFSYSVGSIAFLYSTMLWGHQTAAFLLFLAFHSLVTQQRLALAGFCAALGVLCEYSVAVALPALGAYALWHAPPGAPPGAAPRRLAIFCAAGMPVLIAFGIYHKLCFGGWFTLPASFFSPEVLAQPTRGPYSVLTLPSLEALWGISFGSKGLFAGSPVLLLAIPGFAAWLRDPGHRAEGWVALWTVLGFVLFNTSYNGWHGGWCVGPRYLIPMLPFLASALAWFAPRWLAWPVAVLSALHMIVFAATDITPPHGHSSLLRNAWPMLLDSPERWPAFAGMLALGAALFAIAACSSRRPARCGRGTAESA